MVNFACAQKVPDSTKLRLIKGQKTKFLCGSMPPNPPSLPHAFYTDTYLGKKLKETLTLYYGNT